MASGEQSPESGGIGVDGFDGSVHVAISRARRLDVVAANPRLLEIAC